MKDDEKLLLIMLNRHRPKQERSGKLATEILPEINVKRCLYILDKWVSKGWFEYGVSLGTGWLTDKGRHKAMELDNAITVD